MSAYEQLKEQMLAEPRIWLVTGEAGFIGSNLLEALLGRCGNWSAPTSGRISGKWMVIYAT